MRMTPGRFFLKNNVRESRSCPECSADFAMERANTPLLLKSSGYHAAVALFHPTGHRHLQL
jgi:hypothetical protein